MASLIPPSRISSRVVPELASVASKCISAPQQWILSLTYSAFLGLAHLRSVRHLKNVFIVFMLFCFVFLNCLFSYRWIRFEVCRPGDGQVPHSLSEDDASINFEAFQRHHGFENIKTEHITGMYFPKFHTQRVH